MANAVQQKLCLNMCARVKYRKFQTIIKVVTDTKAL